MSDIQTTNYPSTAKVLVRSENMSRTAEGFGSSKLKNADDPMAPENRRTEFEII